jgi:Fic/DOC family
VAKYNHYHIQLIKIMPTIGYQWLSDTLAVQPVQPFAITSAIGKTRATSVEDDIRREVYVESYRPNANIREHLTFAFKHEGIHLEFLARLCRLPAFKIALEAWILEEPTGAYARRAGFFYEWLTGETLSTPDVKQGNYVDALDSKHFFTGTPFNNPRWRVRDNLPGSRDYCPIIRSTPAVKTAESYDVAGKISQLESDFGMDMIRRSTVWLTAKESRASFLIEHEQDQEDRIQRFATVLETECGLERAPFSRETLQSLQRSILGESALRYGIRQSPVYVGHTVRYQPFVDYIAPHWEDTTSMLQGLSCFLSRTQGKSSIVRAAIAAFGFVYIHPMADGNGRISRFLINDVLRRDGLLPSPLILPISATITHGAHNRADYDKVLERFSRPFMRYYAGDYAFGPPAVAADGIEYNLYFKQYDDAQPAWRYPDLTAQAQYLAKVIDATLTVEMREEARFLRANDDARQSIKAFLEAPNIELDSLIRSIRQNNHQISKQLLKRFPILAEQPQLGERIIEAIADAFGDLSATH